MPDRPLSQWIECRIGLVPCKDQIMWAISVDFLCRIVHRWGLADQSGATAMEYALIGTGIGVAIIAALFSIGDEIVRLFALIQTTLDESTN